MDSSDFLHKVATLPRRLHNSNIYKYYPTKDNFIHCIVCNYRYKKDAPLSTLQKHLRVKHGFSIRNPLTPTGLHQAIYNAKRDLNVMKNISNHQNYFSCDSPSSKESPCFNKSKVKITDLLNPNDVSLENSILEWIIDENIPLEAVSTVSFHQMLRENNPKLIIPSEARLRNLLFQRQNSYSSSMDDYAKLPYTSSFDYSSFQKEEYNPVDSFTPSIDSNHETYLSYQYSSNTY